MADTLARKMADLQVSADQFLSLDVIWQPDTIASFPSSKFIGEGRYHSTVGKSFFFFVNHECDVNSFPC
jgi:hypothetical protein